MGSDAERVLQDTLDTAAQEYKDAQTELAFQDIHFQKIRVTLTFFISPVLHCFF